MDIKDNSTIISGILGTSNSFHRRNIEGSTIGGSEEHTVDRTNKETGYCATSNKFEPQNSSADPNKSTVNGKEKPKIHRLGSYIDWGASAFDFSSTTGNNVIVPDSTVQNDIAISQKNTFNNFESFLSTIDQNVKNERDINKSLQYGAPYETNEVPIPPPGRTIRRRQSILHIVEDNKMEAASQAVLSDDVLSTSLPNSTGISNYGAEERVGNSVLGGIMGSWFFKNESIDKDSIGGTIQLNPEMSMEGIGGGELTSKVVSALNLNPTSRAEGGKMNTWMPASF